MDYKEKCKKCELLWSIVKSEREVYELKIKELASTIDSLSIQLSFDLRETQIQLQSKVLEIEEKWTDHTEYLNFTFRKIKKK